MPGGRAEFARSRENISGYYFLEYFIGPNYTYKKGDFTLKASLWYYYMGFPQRGRMQEKTPHAPLTCSTGAIGTSTTCASTGESPCGAAGWSRPVSVELPTQP